MIFYSVHFNRPDFISIQKKCIDRIGGRLVVIDNSNSGEGIKKECDKLGISYYRNYNGNAYLGNPSFSHGSALNFTRSIIDYSSDWCLIDHDFFPTQKIDFENFDIISIFQTRGDVKYLWPGFIAAKKHVNISDIDFFPVHGVGDTGVGTERIIKSNKYKIKGVHWKTIVQDIPKEVQVQKFPTLSIIDGIGIHYLNGSSWMSVEQDVVNQKNEDLIKIINSLSYENSSEPDSNK